MHRTLFERILFGLALLGILTTVHLNIQQNRGFDRGCLGFTSPDAVEATFDCNVVTQSSAGKLFGVSNALLGLLFYVVVAGVCAGIAFLGDNKRIWLKRARLVLLGGGFLYSMYLSAVQYVVIEQFCLLCLTSASIVTILFIVQVVYLVRPGTLVRARDERPALASEYKLYGGAAALILLLVVADFGYFGSLEPPTPNPSAQAGVLPSREVDIEKECFFDDESPYYENFDMLIDEMDAIQGNPEAPVTLVEFFDPNCPHCKTVHPLMEAIAAKYPDKLRLVFKPVAIVGRHSIPQVTALHVAGEEGKFFEMMDLQFEHQKPGGNSLDELRDFAEDIGLDGRDFQRRMRSGQAANRTRRQTQIFRDLGMRGVPRLVLNGRVLASRSRSVACLSHFIEQALPADTVAVPTETSGD